MRLGLRWKSALAVSLSATLVLGLSAIIAARVVRSVQQNLGEAFARNATQFNKQRLLTPVARELALSQRLADSQTLKLWLDNPSDSRARQLFFREAEGYRRAFSDHSYFVADIARHSYYFNDTKTPFSEKVRQTFNPKNPADAWFFGSIKNTENYNLNVDYHATRHETKVWINVMHRENGRKAAIAGTGLNLTQFLKTFVSGGDPGVTPMILGLNGAIQAHPNPKLIALNSGTGSAQQKPTSTVFNLLEDHKTTVQSALEAAKAKPDSVQLVSATFAGKSQLLAISYVPELRWHIVTAVDLNAAQLLDSRTLALPLVLGAATLVALLVLVAIAVNRVVVSPLLRLTKSVHLVESGSYSVEWPRGADDEIGDLSRAFETMTAQIRNHTDQLESLVDERTSELRDANQHINDSIQYASLIQSAILPKHSLSETFGADLGLLWLPRDVVGGDLYLFRADERGCLLGLVDCAGHGVAGAFMTMIAHAAFQSAVDEVGLSSPAAIIARLDEKVRATLGDTGKQSGVATNMDAALVYFERGSDELVFCGAHLNLFCCNNGNVTQFKGARSSLGGRKVPELRDMRHPIAQGETFYLSTDGFLDQAGGDKGFSFGATRFSDMIGRHAMLPLDAQSRVFAEELRTYRGKHSQRDDIGVLAFARPSKIELASLLSHKSTTQNHTPTAELVNL
ncbi:HAMP domain-containing protein [bacterium]|nr:MAG: HAMP domain-containing protein [bacterium]